MQNNSVKVSIFSFKILIIIFSLITINLFFKKTKGLYWIASGLSLILFFYQIIYYKDLLKSILQSLPKSFILSLLAFYIFIIPYAFISHYPLASLEAFFLNYFSSLLIFILLAIYLYTIPFEKIIRYLFIPFSLINLSANIYYTLFLVYKCRYEFFCFTTQAIDFINSSLLKGIVITSFPYVFFFLLFIALAFHTSSKIKALFLLTGFYDLFMILLLGRRGALLGLLTGVFFLMVLTKNKKIRYSTLIFFFVLLVGLGVLLPTKLGKEIFIREDKINYLFTFQYEKFAEAGSFGQRLYIWPIYIKKILEDPFSGTGLGRRVQKRALPQTNERALKLEHAHNIFLNLSLQAGIQSALAFFMLYLVVFTLAYRLWKNTEENPFTGALFLFFIAYFVMSLLEGTEEGTRFTPFWMALGILIGEWAKNKSKASLIEQNNFEHGKI